jgi:uncharacterized protein YcaQ
VIDRALALCDQRAAAFDPRRAVLVHGDAHGWNTLAAGDGTYKFVDVEGLWSEPEHDLGVAMREYNEPLVRGDTARLVRARAEFLAARCAVDPQVVWEWGFIERVSTGLANMRDFDNDDGATFLDAVCDAQSARSARPPGHSISLVSTVHRLSRRDARRIAVRAQLLDAARPTDFMGMLRHLTMLQVDPTSSIAPSADLVAWSRLGASYSPDTLRSALRDHEVVELRAMLRPGEDIALYRTDMAQWPGTGEVRNYKKSQRDWVQTNDLCRLDILRRLKASGPLTSRDLPDSCVKPWASTGWNDNKNVAMLLDFMVQRGEVAIAGRKGRDRLWDLAERVYPATATIPAEEAERLRNERRLRALGIARARGPECPVEPADVGDAGEAALIEGVRGEWRVDPTQLGRPFSGRAALLSPFDRLLHERTRTRDLFQFDYALEMYKPAAKRRWGYYALPILYGDQLVGKLDAAADRTAGVLRVDAIHEDAPFTASMRTAIEGEIADLAQWLQLDVSRPG